MILIVSHNNLHLTKRAVASANHQTACPDVMVVDNNSSDGTVQWLNTKGLAGVNLRSHRSLAACWNMGIQAAFHKCSMPVLVINNDVELRPDAYGELYHSIYSEQPFVTGVSVSTVQALDVTDTSLTSPHPDFSCFMITPEVYKKVGPFDEEFYPCYYEDNDYHVRMHKKGIRAVSINLPFLHHRSQTLKNADPAEASLIRAGAEACKKRFKEKWGCLPGTPEYDKLFT